MKKVLLALFVLVASSVLASAQIAPGRAPLPENNQDILYQNGQYVELLAQQNKLLQSRKIAKIVSLTGAGVAAIGSATTVFSALLNYDPEVGGEIEVSPAGSILTSVGSIAMAVGGIWLLVNDFKLINSQKRINENLILRYGPTGVALQF